MFGQKIIDTVTLAEKESTEKLGFISDFINQLTNAREDSLSFAKQTKTEISRLEKVVKNCKEVETFVDRIIKR